VEKYIRILKSNGLKITPKRKEIINFFIEKDRYATVEEVWNNLKLKFKKIGLPTVYRNLEKFSEIGILTEIRTRDNKAYYGLCNAENPKSHHHHIICVKCHKVRCIDFCNFNEITEKIEKESGFKILNHFLQIKGICSDCLQLNEKNKSFI